MLEASDWNEPVLITENTGNLLLGGGAVSFSKNNPVSTVQSGLKLLFSRNYLLDWIVLHGVCHFSQATLNFAVNNLDDYMQGHRFKRKYYICYFLLATRNKIKT